MPPAIDISVYDRARGAVGRRRKRPRYNFRLNPIRVLPATAAEPQRVLVSQARTDDTAKGPP
jgi:hypothetical protein